VVADEHVVTIASNEPRRLPIEWTEIGKVLVDEASDREVVGSP
jgi:hypothetical protein